LAKFSAHLASRTSYASKRLFEPMGAELPQWHRPADSHRFGAVGIHVRARDMVKLGETCFLEKPCADLYGGTCRNR
jgi:hypothetical protein